MTTTPNTDNERVVRARLPHTLFAVETPAPDYRGKVRDVFHRGDELLIVTTDRVSAFDVVLGAVPLKGALLTEQACFWLNASKNVMNNHLIERIHDQAMRCQKAEPLRVEMVVRGYLAGSLLRTSAAARGNEYGLTIDPGMQAHARFDEPIITPTTKADIGEHDMPISLEAIVAAGLVSKRHVDEMVVAALELFKQGSAFSLKQGLLLVDTKYEFGLVNGRLTLIDEIHTADSSRFWIASSYQERVSAGQAPEMLDKERLRKTLLDKGYDGKDVASLPKLDDDMRVDLACHYWQLTERLTGMPFAPSTRPLDVAAWVNA
jgi:phosphoribosylaminoimidazole-succinocarboxamide synthase